MIDQGDLLIRGLVGLVLAAAIALLAMRARALSRTGAAAAALVGTTCIAAGWGWGALLLLFFGASSALSRHRLNTKEERTAAIVAKGGERDAAQVLANGAPFALAALGSLVWPSAGWYALGAGALAAATSDTWATEIGTLAAHPPRSIIGWRRVPPGTSGGVSLPGTLAAVAGAGFIALASAVVGWPSSAAWAALVGGFAGSTADSLLGATLQARRWCSRCMAATERTTHGCGQTTVPSGGLAWLDNDRVNFLSGLIGAMVGVAVGR
jgi:uncharacterized protein (TIGR00297 family)